MLNIENLTTHTMDYQQLENISKLLTVREIDLSICDNAQIREYNKTYRNKDSTTDVLSFPIDNDTIDTNQNIMPLGSIVISIDYARNKAKELKHSIDDEISLLFIHGLLHISGYDHECDNGEMRKKEEEMIHSFNLPKSLIIRTEGN